MQECFGRFRDDFWKIEEQFALKAINFRDKNVGLAIVRLSNRPVP